MVIRQLPPQAIGLLRGGQSIHDAVAVIHELIDNAIDTGVSGLVVSVSANTLDVIQVRDDGHGIVPQDVPLFGRRGCTSKSGAGAGLDHPAPTSFGFRGEALTNLRSCSRAVKVQTMAQGETCGRSWAVEEARYVSWQGS